MLICDNLDLRQFCPEDYTRVNSRLRQIIMAIEKPETLEGLYHTFVT